MRSAPMWKAVAGLALATSMWAGTAGAGEQFQTLTEIRAEAMSSTELAAVEGKVANTKLFNFNPRFFSLESLLGKGGLNLKGTLAPAGALRLPLSKGEGLKLKGGLNDKFHLTGLFDSKGRLSLRHREAIDKGSVELQLSGLPELLDVDSTIRTRNHASWLTGLLDPKRGLNLNLGDHSTDSAELRLSGLLGLLNLDFKGGIGDGEIQPVALLLHPKTGLHLNSNGSISPSIDLRFTSLSGLLDLHLSGSTNLSGKLQLSNLLDLKRGLDLNLNNGPLNLSGELQLLSFLVPHGGLNLLNFKGESSTVTLPLLGLLDPKGLNLNLLGLPLLGRK